MEALTAVTVAICVFIVVCIWLIILIWRVGKKLKKALSELELENCCLKDKIRRMEAVRKNASDFAEFAQRQKEYEASKKEIKLMEEIQEQLYDNEAFQVAVMYLAEMLGYKFDDEKGEFVKKNEIPTEQRLKDFAVHLNSNSLMISNLQTQLDEIAKKKNKKK